MKRVRTSADDPILTLSVRIQRHVAEGNAQELSRCLVDALSLLSGLVGSGAEETTSLCKLAHGLVERSAPASHWAATVAGVAELLLHCGKHIRADQPLLGVLVRCLLTRTSLDRAPVTPLLFAALRAVDPSAHDSELQVGDTRFTLNNHQLECWDGGLVVASFSLPFRREVPEVVAACRHLLQGLAAAGPIQIGDQGWLWLCKIAEAGRVVDVSSAWATLMRALVSSSPPPTSLAPIASLGVDGIVDCGDWKYLLAALCAVKAGEATLADCIASCPSPSIRVLLQSSTQLVSRWAERFPQVRDRLRRFVASPEGVAFLAAGSSGYSALLKKLFPDGESLAPLWGAACHVPTGWRCVPLFAKLLAPHPLPSAVAQLPFLEFLREPSSDAALGIRSVLRSGDGDDARLKELLDRCLLPVGPHHIRFLDHALPLMTEQAVTDTLQQAAGVHPDAVVAFVTATPFLLQRISLADVMRLIASLDQMGCHSATTEEAICRTLIRQPDAYWSELADSPVTLSHWVLFRSLVTVRRNGLRRLSDAPLAADEGGHHVVGYLVAHSIFVHGHVVEIDRELSEGATEALVHELQRQFVPRFAAEAAATFSSTVARLAASESVSLAVRLARTLGWSLAAFLSRTHLEATAATISELGTLWGASGASVQHAFCSTIVESVLRGEGPPPSLSNSAVLCAAIPVAVRAVRRKVETAAVFDRLAASLGMSVGSLPKSCGPIQYAVLHSALMAGLSPDEFAVCIQFCNAQGERPSGWVRVIQAEPKRDQCLKQIRPELCRLTSRLLGSVGDGPDSNAALLALETLMNFLQTDCDLVASNITATLLLRAPVAGADVIRSVISNASQQYLDANAASLAVALGGGPALANAADRLEERTKGAGCWPAVRFVFHPSEEQDWDAVANAAVVLLRAVSGDRRLHALHLLYAALTSLSCQARSALLTSEAARDLSGQIVASYDTDAHAVPATKLLGYLGLLPEGDPAPPACRVDPLHWREFVGEALGSHCASALETNYDRAAFTVQELIRVAACQEQRCDVDSLDLGSRFLSEYGWWSSLGLRKQSLYEPFLTSSYIRPDRSSTVPDGPVYVAGMSCGVWQSALCKKLVPLSNPPFRSLFDVFRPVASANGAALSFLLRACVVHLTTASTDRHTEVADEINWVSGASSDDTIHQCVADLLGCIRSVEDQLTKRGKTASTDDRAMLHTVRAFWDRLERGQLVAASLRCGAHKRALFYTEGARVLPRDGLCELVPSLRAIGEHAAARSLAAGGDTVADGGVFDFHSDNEREDGLAVGEQMMVRGMSGGAHRYVAALTGLGQFSAVVWAAREHRGVEGVLQWAQEAAWRLGAWDVVEPTAEAGFACPLKSLHRDQSSLTATVEAEFGKLAKTVFAMVQEVGSVHPRQLSLAVGFEDILASKCASNDDDASVYIRLRARQPSRSSELCALHSHLGRLLGVELGPAVQLQQGAELVLDGRFTAAISALKQFELESGTNVDEEVSDILWSVGRKLDAVQLLSDASRRGSLPPEVRGRLLACSAERGGSMLIHNTAQATALLEEALTLAPQCQDTLNTHGMFHYAQYTASRDNLLENAPKGDKALEAASCARHAVVGIQSLGSSLAFGGKHLILAMPRMLTLWLDGTSLLEKVRGHTASLVQDINAAAAGVIERCSRSLFAIGLPQLLSRLGHECADVIELISQLVLRLVQLHPQPTLWQVLPMFYSASNKSRAELVSKKILGPLSGSPLVAHMKVLFETFTGICSAGTAIAERSLTELSFMKGLLKLLPTAKFIMPRVTSLYPSLLATCEGSSLTYQGTHVYIASFANRVDLMSSLMKPKRIRIVDSSGASNYYLMKSKDEPRKDIRMMEIAMIVNHLLQRGSSAKCALKRYAVLALSDDCAAIEWIANTVTLRKLAEECYALDGTGVSLNTVKQLLEKVKDGRLTKLGMFEQHIFPAAPPVLHHWLVRSFATPHLWYNARMRFTQSCASWSMCGHIVGLGDRHGENLLLCVDTGEVMHVDFAVMFDKGELLEVPERVRFRLTPNLVDAMGVAGARGEFQSTSEAALGSLCGNKDVVLGVLETFTHDPLIEWSKRGGTDVRQLMKRCQRRLNGFLDLYGLPRDHTSLSHSGQVSRLIDHSCSRAVLSEMYIWWMAWM